MVAFGTVVAAGILLRRKIRKQEVSTSGGAESATNNLAHIVPVTATPPVLESTSATADHEREVGAHIAYTRKLCAISTRERGAKAIERLNRLHVGKAWSA